MRARGGLFFEDLKQQVGGFPGDILDALLALVRNGEVSNDTLMPLRPLRRPVRASVGVDAASAIVRFGRVRVVLGNGGAVVARGVDCRVGTRSCSPGPCRLHGAARPLRRVVPRGVCCRVHPGGFSQYYPVLKALEERGKVRRGFYVDTVGATQFSIPGVDDQLRQSASVEAEPVWLSVVDPAQPYGSIFGWPTDFPVKPTRKSGGLVLFHGGQLVALLASCATKLLVRAPDDEAHQQAIVRALSDGLHRLPVVLKRRSLIVETINGRHAREYPGLKALQRTGVGLTTGGFNCGWSTTRMRARQAGSAPRSADVEGPQQPNHPPPVAAERFQQVHHLPVGSAWLSGECPAHRVGQCVVVRHDHIGVAHGHREGVASGPRAHVGKGLDEAQVALSGLLEPVVDARTQPPDFSKGRNPILDDAGFLIGMGRNPPQLVERQRQREPAGARCGLAMGTHQLLPCSRCIAPCDLLLEHVARQLLGHRWHATQARAHDGAQHGVEPLVTKVADPRVVQSQHSVRGLHRGVGARAPGARDEGVGSLG